MSSALSPRAVLAATLGTGLLLAAVPAARAFEYGPEAEAAFVSLCVEQRPGTSAAACLGMAERLQSQVGYEAFLDNARRGPDGFAATRMAAAPPAAATLPVASTVTAPVAAPVPVIAAAAVAR